MTRKNGKLLIAAAVLMALIAGNLYADPMFGTSSPQGDVTRGRIESDADYFMSVRNYANMDFDRWWGSVSYKTQSVNSIYDSNALAQIGTAARFGGVYTALSYSGTGLLELGLVRGTSSTIYSYTEQVISGRTWKIFDVDPEIDYRADGGNGPRLRNEFSFLLGFADMGFRLYYAATYQSNSVEDFIVQTNYYKSRHDEYGHINPGITWGMTRALIPGIGIKPQVNIDLDIYRESRIWERYNNIDTGETWGTEIHFSANKFIPGLSLGLGGITLAQAGNFNLEFDLDYGIKLHLYYNNYSYQDADNKWQTRTIQGGWSDSLGSVSEVFEMQHSLIPAIGTGWSGERIRLGSRLRVPMTVHTTNTTRFSGKAGSTDGSLVKQGFAETQNVYTINPVLDLAMQWEIVPSRLFLNAGGSLGVFETLFTVTDMEEYENDEIKPDSQSYTQRNYKFTSASTALYLGLTFNLTRFMELQATMGVDSNNTVNVFSASINNARGGFVNFGNILIALKF